MKIAIISDSHDNLVNLNKFLIYCEKNNIDIIFHCGDWCAPAIFEIIRQNFQGEVYGIFGNVHAENNLMLDQAKKFNIHLKKELIEVKIDNIKMAIVHEPAKARKIAGKKLDLIFYGHTHKPWQDKINNTFLINPGTLAGMFMKATFATYNTKTKKLKLHILDEIK